MHDEENYRYIGKNVIDLTVKENKILSLLIQRKGKIVTHKELTILLYGIFDHYSKLCMMNKMCKLRKKLKGEVEIITRNYIGYTIRQVN